MIFNHEINKTQYRNQCQYTCVQEIIQLQHQH